MLLTAGNRPSTGAKCMQGSRRARKLQSVKMHQLILMRFNSSARDAKPENVLIASPKNCGPSRNDYGPPLFSYIFGQCLRAKNWAARSAGTPLHFDDACVASLCPFLSLSHSPSLSFSLSVSLWLSAGLVVPLLSLTKVISMLPSPIVTNWHKCPAAGTESPINASYLQGFIRRPNDTGCRRPNFEIYLTNKGNFYL